MQHDTEVWIRSETMSVLAHGHLFQLPNHQMRSQGSPKRWLRHNPQIDDSGGIEMDILGLSPVGEGSTVTCAPLELYQDGIKLSLGILAYLGTSKSFRWLIIVV